MKPTSGYLEPRRPAAPYLLSSTTAARVAVVAAYAFGSIRVPDSVELKGLDDGELEEAYSFD